MIRKSLSLDTTSTQNMNANLLNLNATTVISSNSPSFSSTSRGANFYHYYQYHRPEDLSRFLKEVGPNVQVQLSCSIPTIDNHQLSNAHKTPHVYPTLHHRSTVKMQKPPARHQMLAKTTTITPTSPLSTTAIFHNSQTAVLQSGSIGSLPSSSSSSSHKTSTALPVYSSHSSTVSNLSSINNPKKISREESILLNQKHFPFVNNNNNNNNNSLSPISVSANTSPSSSTTSGYLKSPPPPPPLSACQQSIESAYSTSSSSSDTLVNHYYEINSTSGSFDCCFNTYSSYPTFHRNLSTMSNSSTISYNFNHTSQDTPVTTIIDPHLESMLQSNYKHQYQQQNEENLLPDDLINDVFDLEIMIAAKQQREYHHNSTTNELQCLTVDASPVPIKQQPQLTLLNNSNVILSTSLSPRLSSPSILNATNQCLTTTTSTSGAAVIVIVTR
ncbi:unnamed protein product [Schistosoma intercalatum]|nr:unnamed protein product [Schistosoma intercalatum]